MSELIPIHRLRRDGGTQLRVEMSLRATTEYAEALAAGEQFPPLVVFDDGESIWLADGFHRYDAYVIVGVLEVECEIRQGTRQDAILYAAQANQKHGVRLTPADREKIIGALRLEFPADSTRELARKAGMPFSTVGVILRRQSVQIAHLPTEQPTVSPADPIAMALSSLPEAQATPIHALLTAPLVPQQRAEEAAQRVAEMEPGEQETIATLAASPDEDDRAAAVALVQGKRYVDEAFALVEVSLGHLKKGLKIHRGDCLEGGFVTCIQHLEGLLMAIEDEQRSRVDVFSGNGRRGPGADPAGDRLEGDSPDGEGRPLQLA